MYKSDPAVVTNDYLASPLLLPDVSDNLSKHTVISLTVHKAVLHNDSDPLVSHNLQPLY